MSNGRVIQALAPVRTWTFVTIGTWALVATLSTSAHPSPVCADKSEVSRLVTAISGPNSLRLDDASEVVILGTLLPQKFDNRSSIGAWPPAIAAAQTLARVAVGKSIALIEPLATRDRYGRRRGQIFVQTGDERIWLQALLLRLGQARVDVAGLPVTCARLLLDYERQARQAKRGLWDNGAYHIRQASRPRDLLRYRSSFQIVRGRVRDVARTRTRVYVNFGDEWRTDFTAGLSRSIARTYARHETDVARLKGKLIEVRGWIERRGGPFIQVRHTAQIAVIRDRKRDAVPNAAWRRPGHRQRPQTKKHPTDQQSGVFDL
ncbi:MAG: thermonuclease family protein [Hyphomicrobiaceae bacterium]